MSVIDQSVVSGNPVKILITSSNNDNTSLIQAHLAFSGYKCLKADSPEQAEYLIENDSPTAVIFDIQENEEMWSGFHTAIREASISGNLPFVFVAAQKPGVSEFPKWNAYDSHIPTPFTAYQLVHRINKIVVPKTIPDIKDKRILIIDDDEEDVYLVQTILNDIGCNNIHLASRGLDGVSIADEVKPDIVITDIALPDMNGVQICQHISQNPELKNTKVIAISGRLQGATERLLTQAGADRYCEKNSGHQSLMQSILSLYSESDTENSLKTTSN